MEQINLFHKKINADFDYSKISNDEWVFPTQNIHIFNREGQGFVASVVKGNQEVFRIRDNYFIIGAKEYDGIVFIISTDGAGRGEIGCYPSPQSYIASVFSPTYNVTLNPNATGFVRTYKAFPNYTDNIDPFTTSNPARKQFNTPLFNMYINYVVDMEVRKDYDGSYNVYFADFNNPLRLINSGFDDNGLLTQRYYWQGSFPNLVSVIPGTGTTMKIQQWSNGSAVRVEKGGTIKSGNYIVYIGYMDQAFTPTPYLFESMPIQVFKDNYAIDGEFAVQGQTGAVGLEVTDKQITLYLENIDTNYKYLNVAYIRNYASDNMPNLQEYYGIITPIPITGEQMPVTIINHDDSSEIEIGAILQPLNKERCCKTVTSVNNYLFGGNWKSPNYHNQELVEFAKRIEVFPHTEDLSFRNLGTGNYYQGDWQYKDYLKTYDNVGYFRSEPYPFSIVFEMTDGTLSNAYPCRGIDALNLTLNEITNKYNTNDPLVNEKGLFRFPKIEKLPLIVNKKIQILGAKFKMVNAISYMNSLGASSFVKNNVRNIYIARGDRIENLRYQGLSFHMAQVKNHYDNLQLTRNYHRGYYNSTPETAPEGQKMGGINLDTVSNLLYPDKYYYDYNDITGNESSIYHYLSDNDYTTAAVTDFKTKKVPVYCGHLPCYYTEDTASFDELKDHSLMIRQIPLSIGDACFYSQDFNFNNENDISNINYLEEQGQIIFTRKEYEYNNIKLFPRYGLLEQEGLWVYYTKKNKLGTVSFVPEEQYPTTSSDYISSATDAWTGSDIASSMCYIKKGNKFLTNRDYRAKKYLSFETELTKQQIENGTQYTDYQDKLVNLYRTKPEDINIVNLYNQTIPYYIISQPQDINTLTNFVNSFRGDCFLQKSYFKQSGWGRSLWIQGAKGVQPIDGEQVFNDKGAWKAYHTHGIVFGIITENKINVAMRHNDATSTYLPLLNEDAALHILTPITKTNGNEKYLINTGYNKTLGENVQTLYDPNIPFYQYKRPTRIRFSEINTPYSFIDGWRLWDINSYRDYDLKEGEINKILEIGSTLISVQEHAINEHMWGEGKLELQNNQADVALGNPYLLSEQANKRATFGSQHLNGVMSVGNRIYGVDFNEGKIWMFYPEYGELSKKMMFTAKDLTKEALIETEMKLFKANYYSINDKVSRLPEDIYNGNGIAIGYNQQYDSVYFTLMYRNKQRENIQRTFCFNEKLMGFTGDMTFYPEKYINFVNQLLSFKSPMKGIAVKSAIYMHDINTDALMFYDEQHIAKLSYIVTGIGEKNASAFTKQFYALELETPEIEFTRILYKTLYQEGRLEPFMSPTNFWENPEYLEHKWKVPISVSETTEQDFNIDSQMTGKWLRVTVEYEGKEEMYLINAITAFKLSQT